LVFALYFAAVIAFAWLHSRQNRGVEGYLLANRRMGGLAIGLSVMATQASAITYIGTTGQAFGEGMEFLQFYFGLPLAMVIISVTFAPAFYRAKVFTAYEYLERRFDARTRTAASIFFMVSRGMSAGIVLYAPSIVLSVIMGWSETTTIMIMGAVTVGYTLMGGMTAVIWTDVVQMLVLFAGIAAALFVLFGTLPEGVGVADAAYVGGVHGMWQAIDLSWDPSNRFTLWSGLIGGLFLAMGYFGADQSQVQRYLTARSLRQSRVSLLFNAVLKVPMQAAILAIGVMLFVFYHFEPQPLVFNTAERETVARSEQGPRLEELEVLHQRAHSARLAATMDALAARRTGALDQEQEAASRMAARNEEMQSLRAESRALTAEATGAATSDVNYVFPTYLVSFVPAGLLGLLIAVIFAAAMSSLDSELTALTSASVMDVYKRHLRPNASDRECLVASRTATACWGALAAGFALYAGQLGSLIEAVNRVGSLFYGSLLGVFLLAFFAKRATPPAAFFGLLAGMLSVLAASYLTEIAWLWYNVVGTGVTVASALLISLVTSERGGSPEHATR